MSHPQPSNFWESDAHLNPSSPFATSFVNSSTTRRSTPDPGAPAFNSAEQIRDELARLIKLERIHTNQLLTTLRKAEDERSYLQFNYVSLFDWLVRYFKYSEPAAMRRLEAVRLMRVVPDVEARLGTGSLNLTTLNKAQQVIKAQEKATGTKLSVETKAEALKKIENLSAKNAEVALLEKFPEAAPEVTKPKAQKLKGGITRHHLNLDPAAELTLKRVKELLSHKFPDGNEDDIFAHLLAFYVGKKDPLRKSTSAAEVRREGNAEPSKAQVHRSVFQTSGGGCVHEGPNGEPCGSRHQIEKDHVIPKGRGGKDEAKNYRPLCRVHNFTEAERVYGKKHISKFRKKR